MQVKDWLIYKPIACYAIHKNKTNLNVHSKELFLTWLQQHYTQKIINCKFFYNKKSKSVPKIRVKQDINCKNKIV